MIYLPGVNVTNIADINVPMELEGARIVRLAGTELQKKIDPSLELGSTSAFDALNRDVYRIVDRYSITQGETVEVGARTHTGLSVGF